MMMALLFGLGFAHTTGHTTVPNTTLNNYLTSVADWVMTTNVGSNNLTCAPGCGPKSHIFENANLARILLATHKIAANDAYLAEGLRWCDSFIELKKTVITSTGKHAVLWDTGYNETFIADTGTAIVALALCHELQPIQSKANAYLQAMQQYVLFVRYGCKKPPPIGSGAISGRCPPTGKGWIAPNGGLGDGWYRGMLNLAPYTISTATMGSCGLVEFDDASKNADPELAQIAIAAACWIVNSRTADGRIPYIISPADASATTYQPISYSTESFIDVDMRYASARAKLIPLRATCDWLVSNQSADGSWGKFGPSNHLLQFTASGDTQRSPRVLSLLQWCVQRLSPPDHAHARAAARFVDFLLQPKNSAAFGVNNQSLPTGFVGLAIADYIRPWSTFRTPRAERAATYVLGLHPSTYFTG